VGNVGIGTTSPYAKLSVVGPVVAQYFHATSSATSTFAGPIKFTDSGNFGQIGYAGEFGELALNENFSFDPDSNGLNVSAINGLTSLSIAGGNFAVDSDGNITNAQQASTTITSANTLCISTDCRTSWPSGSSQWITNGSDIYYNTGKVGIGTSTPFGKLSASTFNETSRFPLFVVASSSLAVSTTTPFLIDWNGYVGVGSSTPMSTFSVNGNSVLAGTLVVRPLLNFNSTDDNIFTEVSSDVVDSKNAFSVYDTNASTKVFNINKLGNTMGGVFLSRGTSCTTAPAFAANADPNTGLCIPGSDILRLVTNGAARLSVLSNGTVGIGTTSPYANLVVASFNDTTQHPLFVVASSSLAVATATPFAIDAVGNITQSGTTPTLSSCGAAPRFSGTANNAAGNIIVGSGNTTACTITFASPPTGATPICVGSFATTTARSLAASTTATTLVFSAAATMASSSINYMCQFNN
jgi:hypothetical protein